MNDPSKNIQDAICRLASAVDSLLVNGVLICVTQWDIAKSFIQDLVQKAKSSLQEVGEASGSSAGWMGDAERPLDRMGSALLALTDFRNVPQEEVVSLSGQLAQEYRAFTAAIKNLEAVHNVAEPFYESRPPDSARRIEELLNHLSGILLDERADKKRRATAS